MLHCPKKTAYEMAAPRRTRKVVLHRSWFPEFNNPTSATQPHLRFGAATYPVTLTFTGQKLCPCDSRDKKYVLRLVSQFRAVSTNIKDTYTTTLTTATSHISRRKQRRTFHDQVENAALEANHHVERSNIFAVKGLPSLRGALGGGIPFEQPQHAVATKQRFILSGEEVANLDVRSAERERLWALGILSGKLHFSAIVHAMVMFSTVTVRCTQCRQDSRARQGRLVKEVAVGQSTRG